MTDCEIDVAMVMRDRRVAEDMIDRLLKERDEARDTVDGLIRRNFRLRVYMQQVVDYHRMDAKDYGSQYPESDKDTVEGDPGFLPGLELLLEDD